MLSRQTILTVALASTIVGYFYSVGLQEPALIVEEAELETTPDYFLEGVVSLEFDEDGHNFRTIQAEQLLHYGDRDITTLDNPDILETTLDGTELRANAQHGEVKDGSRDILLLVQAQVIRNSPSGDTITLSADQIHYVEADLTLISLGNASLTSKEGVTAADKITYYQRDEVAALEGHVKGQYEQY